LRQVGYPVVERYSIVRKAPAAITGLQLIFE